MKRDPFTIAKEYLRSSDVQVRKNALTALGVIGSKKSVREMIDVATTDEDTSVKEQAVDELARLYGDPTAPPLNLPAESLADKGKIKALYALAGRLKSRGVSVTIPWKSLLTRLRLAAAMATQLYPSRNWKFRFRGLKSGLFGGIIGLFLFGLFLVLLAAKGPNISVADDIMAAFLISLILAPVLAIVATQRTIPINLHGDRLAGTIVEVGTASFGVASVLLLVLGGGVILVMLTSTISAKAMETLIGILLLCLFFLAAIRFGTIVAFGVFTELRWNRYAQMIVGAGMGSIVITAVVPILRTFFLKTEEDIIELIWTLLLPVSFGIARAFSSIDLESPELRPIWNRASRPLSLVITIVFIIPFIVAILPISQITQEPPPQALEIPSADRGDTEMVLTYPITEVPESKYFRVNFPQKISARLFRKELSLKTPPYMLRLSDQYGKIAESIYTLEIVKSLNEGQYRIDVLKRVRIKPENMLSLLLQEIHPVSGEDTLIITLSYQGG